MEIISVNENLPEDKSYVLIHLTNDNWYDPDDKKGNRYWRVAKFVRGLSEEERDALSDDDQRKITYKSGDLEGNNKLPYVWLEFGPSSHFGQEVDYWCYLPTV